MKLSSRLKMALLATVCVFGGAVHARPPSTMLNDGFFSTGPWVSKQELALGINSPGGVAGLDPSGNLTANVNGVPLSEAVKNCQIESPTTFYGAVNSSSEMGMASNTANLRASGNVMPYFNEAGMGASIYGGAGDVNDVAGIIGMSAFQNVIQTTGPLGVIELSLGQYLTPKINSAYWQSLKDRNGKVINDVQMIAQTSFKPTVATLNFVRDFDTGADTTNVQYYTDNDLNNFKLANSDIKKNIPSVQQVWPFIVPGPDHLLSTDAYWKNVRTALTSVAGGVGIDIPAGNYILNGPTSMAPIIDEIKWANANGVKSLVLLSPYSISASPAGYGREVVPQWRHDEDFLNHVRMFIGWLRSADALPSSWSVVSYSPVQYWDGRNMHGTPCNGCTRVTSNLMGSDDDSANQTVAYVARWVAENAPTSTYTTMPAMGQTDQVCTSTVLSGYKSSKPVIGTNQLGLGSLAYQDYNKAILYYPSIFGGDLRGNFNFAGTNGNVFGANESTPVWEQYNTDSHTLTYSGGKVTFNLSDVFMNASLWMKNNISFQGNGNSGTNGIQFQSAGGTKSSWINGDGNGGIALDSVAAIKANKTFQISGKTTAQIKAITSPADGEIVNNSDTHQLVIYENGAWYPVKLGSAL
ncbi:beta/alpha barrel domain-containing protein [Gluconobacter morbifer]|nr:hypothetical protein [Gluconobacter morbifer]